MLHQRRVPGTYTDAARWPFELASQPGLQVFGDGRGSNTLGGTFTVLNATYGPFGYPINVDAIFEQHCEGATAAFRGEVQVINPPPPPALSVLLSVDAAGSRSGSAAIVHGTVTCNENAIAPVQVTVSQTTRRSALNGTATATVNCSTTPALWQAVVAPTTGAFSKGIATVHAQTSIADSFYSTYNDNNPVITASATQTGSARLK